MSNVPAALPWHRRAWAGWLLRAAGLLLLFAAWRSGAALIARAQVARAGAFDFALALLAYLCATTGAATAALGAHLFDQVPIASRWRRASARHVVSLDADPLDPATMS